MAEKRKTTTSTASKRKYNDKTYKRFFADIRIEDYDEIDAFVRSKGWSKAKFIKTAYELMKGEHKMTSRLFLTMPTGYNTDIFGDAYSDMTPEEIDLALKTYDAIISSLLPEWLSWCGDELYADWNADTGEWAEEVDEDFGLSELITNACEILWSDDLDRIAAKYLTEDE